MKIAASYLSIKENLKENINKLTNCDIDYLHMDVMDGMFVSNKTMNFDELKDVLNNNKPLDIHLMVKNVQKYIDEYKVLKPEFITFHYENDYDIMSLVMYLKQNNIKVGLSIKPNTKVEVLIPYLPFIDLVLVMSVEPGAGGQKFIEESTGKIDKLIELRKNNDYDYLIEVDGGINIDTIEKVKNVDIAVIGNYITSGEYQERINNVKEKIYGWYFIRNRRLNASNNWKYGKKIFKY